MSETSCCYNCHACYCAQCVVSVCLLTQSLVHHMHFCLPLRFGINVLACRFRLSSVRAMPSKFNPFPNPKKGKMRMVLKRPSALKSKEWKNVKYVRTPEALPSVRLDRCKWKRSLMEILRSTPVALVHLLRDDGLLYRWEGAACPHCHKGTLGKLASRTRGGEVKHRCSAKHCQKFVNPHHGHPLFVNDWGSSSTPLATQAALLLPLLNRIPHAAIHRLLHVNHKTIEDMKDWAICGSHGY